MIVWFAGTPGGGDKRLRELPPTFTRRLFSYAYRDIDPIGWYIVNGIELFLDSGAFSAWTKGVSIDIHDYIEFIKQHEQHLTLYANLDVIGEKGRRPNRDTAATSLENLRIMEKAGLRPLPVFHIGEPFEYLQHYIDNYDYIAIGGAVGESTGNLLTALTTIFANYICDSKGYPKVKVHAFGITSLAIMLRFPWYSVDSTTWVMTSRMGGIYVPRFKNGRWIYDEQPWKITVSLRSPDIKSAGKHIHTLTPAHKAIVLRYIEEKGFRLGRSRFVKVPQNRELASNERWAERKPQDKDAKRLLEIIEEDGLCNRYEMRDEINIRYFKDLEQHLPQWPWPFKRSNVLEARLL